MWRDIDALCADLGTHPHQYLDITTSIPSVFPALAHNAKGPPKRAFCILSLFGRTKDAAQQAADGETGTPLSDPWHIGTVTVLARTECLLC